MITKNVTRTDRGTLAKPQRLANGWLKVDGYIGRTGILEYLNPDGSTRREYRPPEEAFASATLESFDMVPFTDGHPKAGSLDASNTKDFQVGTVSNPRQDGDKLRAKILVTDAAVIDAIGRGKVELSCGYCCDVDETPGVTPEGEHYDARQTAVRGNHVALVHAGRAGSEIALRADEASREDDHRGRWDAEAGLHAAIRKVRATVPDADAPKYDRHGRLMHWSETSSEMLAIRAARDAQRRDDEASAVTPHEKSWMRSDPVYRRLKTASDMERADGDEDLIELIRLEEQCDAQRTDRAASTSETARRKMMERTATAYRNGR